MQSIPLNQFIVNFPGPWGKQTNKQKNIKQNWSYHHAVTHFRTTDLLPHMHASKKSIPLQSVTNWAHRGNSSAPPLCPLVFCHHGSPKGENSIYPGIKWGCGHRAGKGLNISSSQKQLPGEPRGNSRNIRTVDHIQITRSVQGTSLYLPQENMFCHITALQESSQP